MHHPWLQLTCIIRCGAVRQVEVDGLRESVAARRETQRRADHELSRRRGRPVDEQVQLYANGVVALPDCTRRELHTHAPARRLDRCPGRADILREACPIFPAAASWEDYGVLVNRLRAHFNALCPGLTRANRARRVRTQQALVPRPPLHP